MRELRVPTPVPRRRGESGVIGPRRPGERFVTRVFELDVIEKDERVFHGRRRVVD